LVTVLFFAAALFLEPVLLLATVELFATFFLATFTVTLAGLFLAAAGVAGVIVAPLDELVLPFAPFLPAGFAEGATLEVVLDFDFVPEVG